ncbi:hypothetical protein SLEP1_g38467 [Rubroshorea leprosula]|nr:hypothetical protein SLEP1_g38467 [Rubroshorea leprosula]
MALPKRIRLIKKPSSLQRTVRQLEPCASRANRRYGTAAEDKIEKTSSLQCNVMQLQAYSHALVVLPTSKSGMALLKKIRLRFKTSRPLFNTFEGAQGILSHLTISSITNKNS